MADQPQGDASPKPEPVRAEANEDAETRAARRELKQSSISDNEPKDGEPKSSGSAAEEHNDAQPTTPPADEALTDTILSPKKKRAHDQLDEDKQVDDKDDTSEASTDSAKDRASRLEPEKKRHRDEEGSENKKDQSNKGSAALQENQTSASLSGTLSQASSSAFTTSGFGKLSAASASPFASLGASKGSGFGSAGAPSLTSFASPQAPSAASSTTAAAPKLSFGTGASVSPFGGLSTGTNGLGGAFGGAFGSALSGAKPIGSFANPGAGPLGSKKPAKPFGAPVSDAEDEEDDNEGDEAGPSDEERAASPEKESEEKKKTRLQRIEVDDGEAGEATIVSVRAKMFHHDKVAGNWKERGAGMLKINVPRACLEFDEAGAPIPGSFDASGLELDEEEAGEGFKGHKVARLLLRQDQTHRVILNTAILPAMKFQEKASLKSVGILFTAFEGEQATPVSITMKMSAANAKMFMNEVNIVLKELQGN